LIPFAVIFYSTLKLGEVSAQSAGNVLQIKDVGSLPDSILYRMIDAGTKKWQQLVRSDVDSSLLYANQVVELTRYADNDSLLFHSLRRVASSLTQQGNFEKARKICAEMDGIRNSEDFYQNFRFYQTLGLVDFYEGKYQKALENHFQSLEAAKEVNLLENIPAAFAEISRVFDEMGQPIKALQYAKEDLHFSLQHSGNRSKFIAHYNLANRYVELDSFDQALNLYTTADSIAQLLDVPVFKDAVTLIKCKKKKKMGDPGKAIPLLKKAVKAMQESGNRRGYLTAQVNLGRALNEEGRYKESIILLKEAFEGLTHDGFQHLAQSCREAYAEALYHTGKEGFAYQMLDQYRIIQDSMKGEETSRTINELEIQYQTAAKEKEILEKEMALAQKTQERNRLVTLAILLSLGLLFIYFLQKQRIEKNRLLAERASEIQNQKIQTLEKEKKILAMASMIEGQENERTRIAKDLHDGLGVLLSSVRRQVQNVQKELEKLTEMDLISDTEKLINTACEEVRRISHDMMPDALINLGLSEAIKDLAYQVEFDHQIKTHVVIPELEIGETQAINIYRIIQEFCNNSIKYSQASNLFIRIFQTTGSLKIDLADDGIGFDLEKARSESGIGIKSIESRVSYMNGYVAFLTDNGTSCDIVLPRLSN